MSPNDGTIRGILSAVREFLQAIMNVIGSIVVSMCGGDGTSRRTEID
jgi:hypothetical protein